MGVGYEEYFGCDETGQSIEDVIDSYTYADMEEMDNRRRGHVYADDDEEDEEEDEDMEWMEEGEDEEAMFDDFRERFSRTFDLAHIRERDLNIMLEALNAILRGFPPGYTMIYEEGKEDGVPALQFEAADVYELMRLCFTNENMAMRTRSYMQAIADQLNAKKPKPLIPDEEIPF